MTTSLTYGGLIKKLQTVGFTENKFNGHIVLQNSQYDSTIVLPSYTKAKKVEANLLFTIRKNLIEKGVLSSKQLNELLVVSG